MILICKYPFQAYTSKLSYKTIVIFMKIIMKAGEYLHHLCLHYPVDNDKQAPVPILYM